MGIGTYLNWHLNVMGGRVCVIEQLC